MAGRKVASSVTFGLPAACQVGPGLQPVLHAAQRAGWTTEGRERLKDLERKNRDPKRANEILRKAAACFAQAELDRRPK
jgi:transposase-like protein